MHLLYPVHSIIHSIFSGDLIWGQGRFQGGNDTCLESGKMKVSIHREKERKFRLRNNMKNSTELGVFRIPGKLKNNNRL